MTINSLRFLLLCGLSLGLLPTDSLQSAETKTEIYAAPTVAEVRTELFAWMQTQGKIDKQQQQEVQKQWKELNENVASHEVFGSLIDAFARIDSRAAKLVESCRWQDPAAAPEAAGFLQDDKLADFFRDNLLLFHARYLTQRELYDEALTVSSQFTPERTVDPVGALFYRAVCQHQLLMKEPGLETLEKLLGQTQQIPPRYASVATLMQLDLQRLQEKSLDEVARQMSDVERRLGLGRGGEKVQEVEKRIVETLDEMIKKLEDQAQASQSASGSGAQGGQSSNPADVSQVKGSTAPGEIDPKKMSKAGDWGDLPPKEEARAKNMINRKFPAHYRQAVEQYFKTLAKKPSSSGR